MGCPSFRGKVYFNPLDFTGYFFSPDTPCCARSPEICCFGQAQKLTLTYCTRISRLLLSLTAPIPLSTQTSAGTTSALSFDTSLRFASRNGRYRLRCLQRYSLQPCSSCPSLFGDRWSLRRCAQPLRDVSTSGCCPHWKRAKSPGQREQQSVRVDCIRIKLTLKPSSPCHPSQDCSQLVPSPQPIGEDPSRPT